VIWLFAFFAGSTVLIILSFVPIVFPYFRLYRRLLGGRWEKRGHWCRYPHCEPQADYRVSKYGVAEDVEDW
jgi:hypothetical protein